MKKEKTLKQRIEEHIANAISAIEKIRPEDEAVNLDEKILTNVIIECFEASKLYAAHAQDLPIEERENLYRRIDALKIAYSAGQDFIRIGIIKSLAQNYSRSL